MHARGSIVWWAIALVCVAGCNQVFGLDLPVGDEPDDTDARDHDARVIDGPADRDGDGVLDGVDVCPDVADPGQFDEDQDGRGDRCDLCPHLGQADDVDNDEDNIPDACDPLPTTSAGRLRWNGFHSGDELDDWIVTGGGAEMANDEVRIAPVLDGELRFVRRDTDGGQERTRVIAGLTIDTPNAGGTARRAIGLMSNLSASTGTDFLLCQIETDLPVTEVRLAEYRLAVTATQVAVATFASALPTEVTLDFEAGATDMTASAYNLSCAVHVGQAGATLGNAVVTGMAAGLTGVRTVGVPVRVRWIVIIDHPATGTSN